MVSCSLQSIIKSESKMFEYSTEQPSSKTYLQVPIIKFYEFLGEELEDKVRELFINHHCAFYVKHGMFVYEKYFFADELEAEDWNSEYPPGENIKLITLLKLKEYLRSIGYNPYPTNVEYRDSDKSCIVPGYAGILFDLDW